MKHRIVILLTLMTCMAAKAQITENAVDAVKNMGAGWNLGNTLDAFKSTSKDFTQDTYWGGQGLESETYWGQTKTKPELFTMMRKAGFGAIRVPVTWCNHMDSSGKVKAEWMARVREVVDYVLAEGLYCILNVHHDTGADSDSHTSWIKADEANYTTNKERYEYLWKQIAEEFRDYDHHLLFEGYNEMLDIYSSWCYASYNTGSQYDASVATSAYKGLNGYAQSFVTTVRNTGGNNATRNLIVNTYAAANGSGTWNTHLKDVLTKMLLPNDTAEGHLIFEVHDYPNITKPQNGSTVSRTFSEIKSMVDGTIKILKDYLVAKGAPVIIGEWGTSNVDAGTGKTDYDVRHDLMLQFVDYYVKQCKANGIATFYWMGITDGAYRNVPVFSQPDLAETIAKAYHGSDFKGEFPVLEDIDDLVVFEGEKALNWGDGISIPAAAFAVVGSSAQLFLTYKPTASYKQFQFYYGDWSSKLPFMAEGHSYSGDYNASAAVGEETTTAFSFSESTYNVLKQKGLMLHGTGLTLYKAELSDPTGITPVTYTGRQTPVYNLSGQRMHLGSMSSGIYIKNGKSFIRK